VNFIPGVGNHFFPDCGGALVFAAPFGHPRQFLLRPGTNVPRQPDSQGLRAGDLSAREISAALEETRESKEIEACIFLTHVRGVGEHGIDFSEQSCQPAQVHLIVAHNSGQRIHRSAPQIIEVMLRDQGAIDIVFAMPAQPFSIEDAAFEFHQSNAAKPQLPQRAGGMQQVQMRSELGCHD